MDDAEALRRLDALDFLAFQAEHSPLSHGRLKLPIADFDFLMATIGANATSHQAQIDAISERTLPLANQVNLPLDGFKSLLWIAHEAVQSVSVDEAVQRG